ITDDLENVVTDAQRQYIADRKFRNTETADLIDGVYQKVGVLEINKNTEVAQRRDRRQERTQLAAGCCGQQAPEIVEQDQAEDQRKEGCPGPAIKHQTFRQKDQVFDAPRRKIVQKQGEGKETEQKYHAVKNHGGTPSFF